MMDLKQSDPACPHCIGGTTVELTGTTSVTIIVHVKLDDDFPGSEHEIKDAAFRYEVGTSSKTETLGPPNGPGYSNWVGGEEFDIEITAESWLTDRDFDELKAKMEVTTDEPQVVVQEWEGTQ